MHELYELKEMLMDELKEYGKKGEMTSGSLEVVDKLSHAIKNLCKIIESYEEEEAYSMAQGGGSYAGGSYARGGRSRASGGSYARGRSRASDGSYRMSGRGSYAQRRDSMGRYSRAGQMDEMVEELHEIMEDAPDEKTRMEFQKFISKIEGM